MDVNHTVSIVTPFAGNGLAANKLISRGSTIIRIASPYLLVVEKEALLNVCSYCLLEASAQEEPLKRCGSCKVPRYCSAICQKADWKLLHGKECPILKELPDVPPTPVRGLLQLLLKHSFGSAADLRWKELEGHTDELKTVKGGKRWDEVLLQAKAAVAFSKVGEGRVDIAIQLLCCMITNAFRATLVDDTPVGLCFEPTIALANHSCNPNAVVIFDGRSVSLRALNDIKEGEQIFISYIDGTEPRDERMAMLKERYFFTCECEKCKMDDSAYHMFLKHPPEKSGRLDLLYNSKSLIADAENLVAAHDIRQIQKDIISPPSKVESLFEMCRDVDLDPIQRETYLKQAANNLAVRKELYALHPHPKILHELYLCYLDQECYLEALVTILFIFLNCDVYNYPQPHHPIHVIRLFTISKLLRHISSLGHHELFASLRNGSHLARHQEIWGLIVTCPGIDFIDSCHAVLILVRELGLISHGKECRFMKEVEAELRDVEVVQTMRNSVTGKRLRTWMVDEDWDQKHTERVTAVFDGLRKLARCVKDLIRVDDEMRAMVV